MQFFYFHRSSYSYSKSIFQTINMCFIHRPRCHRSGSRNCNMVRTIHNVQITLNYFFKVFRIHITNTLKNIIRNTS